MSSSLKQARIESGKTLEEISDYLKIRKQYLEALEEGDLSSSQISEQTLEEHLSTHSFPDPELMIRTSGEYRISNFLLYQLAYAELYFTEVCWPDFRKQNLYDALLDYQQRERRFGKISEQL